MLDGRHAQDAVKNSERRQMEWREQEVIGNKVKEPDHVGLWEMMRTVALTQMT